MGGSGSGMWIRWNTSRTKGFVEEHKCIDARSFPYRYMINIPKVGVPVFAYGMEFQFQIFQNRLEVYHKNDDLHGGFTIPFSLSQGHYGNKRYWFVCPNPSCSKRCRKLFLAKAPNGISFFLCRLCLNLAYRSQNRNKLNRIIDKKWGLVRKLGCESDLIFDSQKPKWMQWKTFNRIREEIDRLDDEAMCGIAALFPMKRVDVDHL